VLRAFVSMQNSLILVVVGASLILCAGCHRSTQEAQLVGAWQIQVPSRRATFVYTFYPDHHFSETVSGVKFLQGVAQLGVWSLHGNELVMTKQMLTNNMTAEPLLFERFNCWTNRLTKLSRSEMTWSYPEHRTTLTLQRVQSTNAVDQANK
jgi:hypothetical protein